MQRFVTISLLVFTLAACGNGDEAPTGVDPCYREQAVLYRNAALTAQSAIPDAGAGMSRAAADMVDATRDRDIQAMRTGSRAFQQASDELLEATEDISRFIDEADGTCP